MRTRRAGQYDRRLQGVNPWRRTIDNLSERIKPVAEAIRGLADDNTVTFACVIYAYAEVDFNPEVFLSRSTVEPGESDHAVGRERRGGLDAEPVARRQIEYPRGFAQVNVTSATVTLTWPKGLDGVQRMDNNVHCFDLTFAPRVAPGSPQGRRDLGQHQ